MQRNAPASSKIASVAVFVLLALATLLSGCGSRSNPSTQPQTAEQRNAAMVAIAQQFGATEDLEAAQVALAPLSLPNPGQAVLTLAEAYIAEGQDIRTTVELIALAKALGPISRMAEEFLTREGAGSGVSAAVAMAPTAMPTPMATATPQPPTETPAPEPTATATDTPEPTATPTETPVSQPQASTTSPINVRSGPGTVYPVVGQLQSGQPVDILGRNTASTWWQVLLGNGSEGWVAASVVDVTDPVDAVAVAVNIPPAPTQAPQPTAAPQATTAPAAPPPPQPNVQPGMQYTSSVRVRPLGQDAQQCGGGEHNIFALVTDQAGNPIDGVRVREVFTGIIRVSGEKGPGRVDFDIYMDGGGQLQIVDADNNPLSAQTIGMPANLPPWDLFYAAGYCNCKPYPDTESCQAGWEARDFRYMPNTHYVYDVVFQRSN